MELHSPPFPRFLSRKWKLRRAHLGLFWIQSRDPPPVGSFSEFIFVAETFLLSNIEIIENIYYGGVAGDASRPPDYCNHLNNNQKVPSLNPGILATVEEAVVGFQVHHNPHHLEGSGDF